MTSERQHLGDEAPGGTRRGLLVGLTGGIGAGKSTVARLLAELGAAHLDADALAHAVLREEPVRRAVAAALGDDVLGADGEVDRRRLGRRVFGDPAARGRLEALTHPVIAARATERLRELLEQHPVVLYEAALLVETGRYREMDLLLVVRADDEVRTARIARRDGLTEEQIRQRMAAQLPQHEKEAVADLVVDNSGDPEATRARAREVFRELLARVPSADGAEA